MIRIILNEIKLLWRGGRQQKDSDERELDIVRENEKGQL